jgi:hypothetical protein
MDLAPEASVERQHQGLSRSAHYAAQRLSSAAGERGAAFAQAKGVTLLTVRCSVVLDGIAKPELVPDQAALTRLRPIAMTSEALAPCHTCDE